MSHETREAGRALDTEIAEKVFGEIEAHAPCGDGLTRTCTVTAPTLAECDVEIRAAYPKAIAAGLKVWPAEYIGPSYSTDIAAASEVIREMRERGFDFTLRNYGTYTMQFERRDLSGSWSRDGDTAPLAICLAALAALLPESQV